MLFVGIDWSDQFLDFHVRRAEGDVLTTGQVRNDLEGLADLYVTVETLALPEEIGIAIETSHGAWVQALLDRGYRIYPVNPKAVDHYRESLSVAGNKSDKIDAKVLAMFLTNFHQDLRPLKPDDPEIVSLRIACQDRVDLMGEHTAQCHRLTSQLKAYYPAFLGLFGSLDSYIALDFLQKYPSQKQMQALTPGRFRSWLKRHSYGCPKRIEAMVEQLKQPTLPVADHLQDAKAPLIRFLAKTIKALNEEIAQRDRQIKQHFDSLPEANWASSLPGAGTVLAPAILACFGRDQDRFEDADGARAFMGTAPVTKSSGGKRGKKRSVHFRRGCWKFARRTLHLFANLSRQFCDWAQAYYLKQRASGHEFHEAIRSLAHKWVKIILAMQRQGTPYVEEKFTHSQERYLLRKQQLQK